MCGWLQKMVIFGCVSYRKFDYCESDDSRRNLGQYCAEKKGDSAIHLAAKYGHVNIVQMLIDCGVDVNAVANMQYMRERFHFSPDLDFKETALHYAVQHKDVRIVKAFLRYSAELVGSYNINTAIQYAADEGHVEIVKLLLKTIEELNRYEIKTIRLSRIQSIRDALEIATQEGHDDVVKLIKSENRKKRWW